MSSPHSFAIQDSRSTLPIVIFTTEFEASSCFTMYHTPRGNPGAMERSYPPTKLPAVVSRCPTSRSWFPWRVFCSGHPFPVFGIAAVWCETQDPTWRGAVSTSTWALNPKDSVTKRTFFSVKLYGSLHTCNFSLLAKNESILHLSVLTR